MNRGIIPLLLAVAGCLPGAGTARGAEGADEPALQQATPGVLLLPVQFRAREINVGYSDQVPLWARTGALTVGLAFETLIDHRKDMHRVEWPGLAPAEQSVVAEHLRTLRTILDADGLFAHAPWRAHRPEAERSIGPGLAWLAQRTGARYAMAFEGSEQVLADWTRFARPWVAMPAPVQSGVRMALLELDTGKVTWLVARDTRKLKDASGRPLADLRDTPTARELLRQLFSSYPAIPDPAD